MNPEHEILQMIPNVGELIYGQRKTYIHTTIPVQFILHILSSTIYTLVCVSLPLPLLLPLSLPLPLSFFPPLLLSHPSTNSFSLKSFLISSMTRELAAKLVNVFCLLCLTSAVIQYTITHSVPLPFSNCCSHCVM